MNSFGRIFRVSIFGESHGEAIGAVMDGVTPGIKLSQEDFMADIARRKSGAPGTTPRIEADLPEILSGVYEGFTTGAPLAVIFRNGNTRSADYSQFKDVPRPGHADRTAAVKWGGFNDPRGGGHFSGRLTLPIVAAGVVAKKMAGVDIEARLVEVGGVAAADAPDGWKSVLENAVREHDSVGGIVECRTGILPAGLGEPFFDSVESLISHAIFAIPGVRGIEFGDGFKAARMKGSEHNDPFGNPAAAALKNGSGGVNGGITNGAPLVFRVAFKPTSSIGKAQQTWDFAAGGMTQLTVPGRHDTCFALRTPVIVEAMTAIVLADLVRCA
ncbi:MAG: chorismate synthase [Bacteroidales bacterium]|nr:chorismate synthase [Bacteroidales bacterium]